MTKDGMFNNSLVDINVLIVCLTYSSMAISLTGSHPAPGILYESPSFKNIYS